MIQSFEYTGEDFKAIMQFEGWKIGFLRHSERFSKFDILERHLETDEAFILLEGCATLFTENEQVKMQPCRLYNIPKGEWHHITVSEDATVMVVENSSTSLNNTERKRLGE